MQTSALVSDLKTLLNRPSVDDLFTDPDDYHDALTRAQEYWYRLVATHYPDLIRTVSNAISSSDDGKSYDLGDDHYGEIEVWTPPGPPSQAGSGSGDLLPPALPESNTFGYYVQGQKIYLTEKRDYDPGIYVRWVPATPGDVDADTDPTLPVYFEDAYKYQAAFYLASTPGFLGDPQFYREQAIMQWEGDPQSPSDAGILGVLSRQSAQRGLQTVPQSKPWFKRIPSN